MVADGCCRYDLMKRNSISSALRLKLMTTGTLMGLAPVRRKLRKSPSTAPWAKRQLTLFLGGDFWANPMEDWRVSEGGAEVPEHGRWSQRALR